jgi:hypothetical protein
VQDFLLASGYAWARWALPSRNENMASVVRKITRWVNVLRSIPKLIGNVRGVAGG